MTYLTAPGIDTCIRKISINNIIEIVAEHYCTTPENIKKDTRKREIVQPRQVAMYYSKHLTKNSLETIGSLIGGKDHATVLHACKVVDNLIETDKVFRAQIKELERRLTA